jgi:hypothetical protein
MKYPYCASLALAIAASASLIGAPANAHDYRWGPGCNCGQPTTSPIVVREAPRIVYHTRVIDTERLIPRYRTVDETRVVVHVRPVINREIVVHREHIHYRNIITRRINTINRYRDEVVDGGVENRYVPSVSESTVVRVVPGSNCCGGGGRVVAGSGYPVAPYPYGYRHPYPYRY